MSGSKLSERFWCGQNKLCINYSKCNFMLMKNHKNINFSMSINHHPISKQSSLKYLGVMLDDKLNCKPQIEKLVTQLSKSCGMLFKLKHYTNISVLKSVYFALFHSYLTYSILNWGSANKTKWCCDQDSGHSIMLGSEIPSGICAKLRTVAASNNRDHACNLSYYCLLALHI